ncbi:hypothetical protein CPB84DRAFT_1763855 [Gymnopilus junonius]|uniref:DUF7918 domain-containing protein n=1 Tax=Gymnopilus junonius TaxID=109634 RepID=A0A9P5TS20_GYMJU|nr:hypothetical protein CPB84DRAFT_1763855 [Gymnopilus junonius]
MGNVCFIESQEGKNFSVHFKTKGTDYATLATLSLDGKVIRSKCNLRREGHSTKFSHINTSKTTKRPFMFATIKTTDDEVYLDAALLSKSAANLYEISVTVRRIIHVMAKKRSDTNCDSEEHVPEIHQMHESFNKANAEQMHQVAYGKKEARNVKDTTGTYFTYDRREVIGQFIFKYRPRHILNLLHCFRVHQASTTQLEARQPAPIAREILMSESTIQAESEVAPIGVLAEEISGPPQGSIIVDSESRLEELPLEVEDLDPDDIPGLKRNNPAQSSNMVVQEDVPETKVKSEELKDIDLSSDDEDVKVLMAAVNKLREAKRKKKAALGNVKKRIKREISSGEPIFFKPGEAREVVDLTSD